MDPELFRQSPAGRLIRGASLEWIKFFLRGVTEPARDAAKRAKRLQDLHKDWRRWLFKKRSSGLLLKLIDHLFATPILTIPQVQHALGIAYRSAKQHVEKLLASGILQQIGPSSYGKSFMALEILEAVS